MNDISPFFKATDFLLGPLCMVLFYMIFSGIVRKYTNEKIKRLFIKAFFFKIFCTVSYALLVYYYYQGADTEMYFHCAQFLRKAVLDDPKNIFEIIDSRIIDRKTELSNYFLYTSSQYPVFEAMHEPGNFLTPKLALPMAFLFDNSYICMAMTFSFFALGGAIRLFKFFYHYFPEYYREIALATLFLPSVGFWSAGVMKDPICFGAVGYLVYAVQNLFVRRKKYASSIIWVIVSIFFLYTMKVYILLAILPAMVLWLFSEINKLVTDKTLRMIMAVLTFVLGGIFAFLLLNYTTSVEGLQSFKLDTITETSAQNRALYEDYGSRYEGSYYSIQTSNPVLLFGNGIIATLFRPFLWEINGITALLSALEALFFLIITFVYIFKKGIGTFFRNIFKQPMLFLCLVFSVVFAAAVGSTALNFGSLSRYKIPCLPFYLIMVLILYRQANLEYPGWLKNILGYKRQYISPKVRTV